MFFSFPVLMYHSISRHKHKLCVSPELFDEHCRALAKAGWRGIPLGEAEDFFLRKKALPRKCCLLTLDDGYLDNYVHAEPILRQHGHYGAIFPVAESLEPEGQPLRPNRDHILQDASLASKLPALDDKVMVIRAGRWVKRIFFCNWGEVKHMHHNGHMAVAPHSLRHDRVVRKLTFTRLLRPYSGAGYFGVPPYDAPMGYPHFEVGHALAEPRYRVAPELFELVRSMVPQERRAATAFLNDEKNRKAVCDAIARLPSLGVLESREEYRARIFQEFIACRDIFAQKLGTPPVSFCWPWGAYSREALEEAQKAGFRVFFTTERGPNLAGRALAVRRLRIREISAKQLLSKMRSVSISPFEAIRNWAEHVVDYWKK